MVLVNGFPSIFWAFWTTRFCKHKTLLYSKIHNGEIRVSVTKLLPNFLFRSALFFLLIWFSPQLFSHSNRLSCLDVWVCLSPYMDDMSQRQRREKRRKKCDKMRKTFSNSRTRYIVKLLTLDVSGTLGCTHHFISTYSAKQKLIEGNKLVPFLSPFYAQKGVDFYLFA